MALIVLCGFGCEPAEIKITKKASYSDLVVTFNAEVQTLDNLEGKRKTLIAEYADKAQADALNAVVNSLGPATKQSNPNDALDRALAAAEAQDQLLDKVRKSPGSKQPTIADYPEELKLKLAELDGEIAKQKERVERARKARDAAESK